MRRLFVCLVFLWSATASWADHLGRLSLSERGRIQQLRLWFAGETFTFREDGSLDGLKLDGRFTVSYADGSAVRKISSPSGGSLVLSYNTAGRFQKISFPGESLFFSYNTDGAVSKISTDAGSLSLSYDGDGRVRKTSGSLTNLDVVSEHPSAIVHRQGSSAAYDSRPPQVVVRPAPSPTSMEAMHQQMTAMQESQQRSMDWHQQQARQYSDLSRISNSETRTEASSSGTLVMPSRNSQVQEVASLPQPQPRGLLSETRSGSGLGSVQVVEGSSVQVLAQYGAPSEECRIRVSASAGGSDWSIVGDSGLQPKDTTSASLHLADATLVSGVRLKVQLVDSKGRIKATVEGTIP